MAHDYDTIVHHLKEALAELQRLKLGPSLAKGRVGEILLAHHLGHRVEVKQSGADGLDSFGNRFEYKISHDNQFNFNFGHARGTDAASLVDRHFSGIEGAYCALMAGRDFLAIAYCPSVVLVPLLRAHLRLVTGKTFQRVFSPIQRFAALEGASWILPPQP